MKIHLQFFVCDLIFKQESELTEHTTNTHANDKNDTEEENVPVGTVEHSEEQNVTNPSVELSESLTNDNDKVYKCAICNFKFSSENGIKMHIIKKHSNFCHFCKQYLSNATE